MNTMASQPALWRVGAKRTLALDRPRLMGILNVTPDSFYDGGRHATDDAAVDYALALVEQGADIIDVGGESTRPGANRIDPDEQIRRTVSVIERLRCASNVIISIDTTLASVAAAALDAGAEVINDVSAGREDGQMLELAAAHCCGLILMHRLVPPDHDCYSHQYAQSPRYDDVVGDVAAFLRRRCTAALAAGVDVGSIVIDPGLGFGKSVEQNLELSRRMPELVQMQTEIPSGGTRSLPVLSAVSRKSFVGAPYGASDPADRLPGTLAMSVAHWRSGVRLFRVHDVGPHRTALEAASSGR
jgi:dihydropteroate synthase